MRHPALLPVRVGRHEAPHHRLLRAVEELRVPAPVPDHQLTAGPEDAPDLGREAAPVGQALEQVVRMDDVDGGVGERQAAVERRPAKRQARIDGDGGGGRQALLRRIDADEPDVRVGCAAASRRRSSPRPQPRSTTSPLCGTTASEASQARWAARSGGSSESGMRTEGVAGRRTASAASAAARRQAAGTGGLKVS